MKTFAVAAACLTGAALAAGCQSPAAHRRDADRAAAGIIAEKQREALGREEPFSIEAPSETLRRRLIETQGLPRGVLTAADEREAAGSDSQVAGPGDAASPAADPMRLTLVEALQVGARGSREYQDRKEAIFRAALDLDLRREEFRTSFAGIFQGLGRAEGSTTGTAAGGEFSVTRLLAGGARLTGRIALDLVRLLTGDRASSLGLLADATVSIPLLGGAGRTTVTEPLTQAERGVVYEILGFERFRKTFAVDVAARYFGSLRARREVENAEENYRGLIVAARRAYRLADAGRLPWAQYDQARQEELAARNRWIAAREAGDRRLDELKTLLGLPPDARVILDGGALDRLAGEAELISPAGTYPGGESDVPPADAPVVLREPRPDDAGLTGLDEDAALRLALERRLDLRVAVDRIADARRRVAVAAESLRGELALLGSTRVGERRDLGSAGLADASLATNRGSYTAQLDFDLPFERSAERAAYRASFIDLARAVREAERLEDRVKGEVRARLGAYREAREGIRIQSMAAKIAARRVASTDLLLQAGRAEMRDVLEAREALVNARNALTAAVVAAHVAALELQRDLGVLEVGAGGIRPLSLHEEKL